MLLSRIESFPGGCWRIEQSRRVNGCARFLAFDARCNGDMPFPNSYMPVIGSIQAVARDQKMRSTRAEAKANMM